MPFEDIGISWKGLSHRPNDGSGFGHICPTSPPPMESSLPSSKHSPANSITIVVIKIIYKMWSGFDVFQVSKTLMLLREEGNDCTSGPERKYANLAIFTNNFWGLDMFLHCNLGWSRPCINPPALLSWGLGLYRPEPYVCLSQVFLKSSSSSSLGAHLFMLPFSLCRLTTAGSTCMNFAPENFSSLGDSSH